MFEPDMALAGEGRAAQNPKEMRRACVRASTALLSLVLALSSVSPTAARPARPRCFGERATILGTASNEGLTGTEGDDVIVGLGGNDVIDARGGDDLVCGGRGNDHLVGYDAHDRLAGGRGDDVVEGDSGGGGFDELLGGPGNDSLDGGVADDRLDGGAGIDLALWVEPGGALDIDLTTGTASGVDGYDTLVLGTIENVGIETVGYCRPHDDRVVGDAGPNALYTSNGNDTIFGGGGTDVLFGGQPGSQNNDIVCIREDGNDTIHGDDGDDIIYGQGNDDALDGGVGSDLVYGGTGSDACINAENAQECES